MKWGSWPHKFNIRRQVNKFLKKHFFFIDSFLFLNIISFQLDPIFPSRPNNMICPIIQNKPLFRRWAALWWWISLLRTISSGLKIGNSRRGLNLENVLDGEAIRSEVVELSMLEMCEHVHYLMKSTFFFVKWGRFFFKMLLKWFNKAAK